MDEHTQAQACMQKRQMQTEMLDSNTDGLQIKGKNIGLLDKHHSSERFQCLVH